MEWKTKKIEQSEMSRQLINIRIGWLAGELTKQMSNKICIGGYESYNWVRKQINQRYWDAVLHNKEIDVKLVVCKSIYLKG